MKKVVFSALLLTTGVTLGNVIFPYWFIGKPLTAYFSVVIIVAIVVEFLVLKMFLPNESTRSIAFATVIMNIVSSALMFF